MPAVVAGWFAAGFLAATAPAAVADTAAGERVFATQCSGCHSVEPERNRAGPTLYGLFGRRSGTLEGFDYSTAMREAGIEWTPETLDDFLAEPREVVPGSKMVLWGLPPEDRRHVIAYLKSVAE